MKFHRTANLKPSRAQKQQMAANAANGAADLVPFTRGTQKREPGNLAADGPTAADQPFVMRSANVKDDPFSCLPPIYDPNASFVVDSAPSEIRELLTAAPEALEESGEQEGEQGEADNPDGQDEPDASPEEP